MIGFIQKILSIRKLHAQLRKCIENLSEENAKLKISNTRLMQEIEYCKSLELKNTDLNNELLVVERQAGMEGVTKIVLHNINNVLNSVNTSASLINEKVAHLKIDELTQIVHLLQEHADHMNDFIVNDPRGRLIPDYLSKLGKVWLCDQDFLLKELNDLNTGTRHIKEIISSQNSLFTQQSRSEIINLPEVIEDALILNRAFYEKYKIVVIRKFDSVQDAYADRVKLLQIIVNLIKNSIESLIEINVTEKKLYLVLEKMDDTHVKIQVSDNGTGITPNNLTRIFTFGFTTKNKGHGFGLYSCIAAVKEMHGTMRAESEGPGKGANFIITLPLNNSLGTN